MAAFRTVSSTPTSSGVAGEKSPIAKKFLDFVASELNGAHSVETHMRKLVQGLSEDAKKDPFYFFAESQRYLLKQPALWTRRDHLVSFVDALSRLKVFDYFDFDSTALHLFMAMSYFGDTIVRDMWASMREMIRDKKIVGHFEPELTAEGSVDASEPLSHLNLRPVPKTIPQDRFEVIKDSGRFYVSVRGADGKLTQRLEVPAGDDYRYPQIRSFPYRDRPELHHYGDLLIAVNEDGIVSAWRKKPSGSWSLTATTYPALRDFNNFNTDYSGVGSEWSEFMGLEHWTVAADSKGSEYLVATSYSSSIRPGRWKIYRLS